MIVYKTTNLLNGKIYIGQDQRNNPNYYGSGILINKAIKKYGKENFRKDVVEYCNSIEHLNEREKYWIAVYNSRDKKFGYNITVGGLGSKGYKPTLEIKLKISKATKGNKNCLGYKHTEEHKRKTSMSMLGKKNSLGNKQTKEHKEKISRALQGKMPKNIDTIKRYNKGKHLTDETKAKLSKSLKGRTVWNKGLYTGGHPQTESSKKRISEALKGNDHYKYRKTEKLKRGEL